jgi:predicted oxidoreductase
MTLRALGSGLSSGLAATLKTVPTGKGTLRDADKADHLELNRHEWHRLPEAAFGQRLP